MRDRSHLKETQRSQHRNIPAPARFFVISACTLHLIHNWCFFFIILNVSFCLYLQHTQHKHPYIRRHSNPQPQQEIDRRTSPQTARPLVQTNGATHSKYRPKYNAAEKVNVFVFNLVPRNESMLGNGDIAPRILNSDSIEVYGQFHASTALPPEKTTVPIWLEAEWSEELVWVLQQRHCCLTHAENRTLYPRSSNRQSRHYND